MTKKNKQKVKLFKFSKSYMKNWKLTAEKLKKVTDF